MIPALTILLVVSFAITFTAIPPLIRFAHRRGFLDQPGPRKVHTAPVPYGGGLAVAAGMLLPVFAGCVLAVADARFGRLSLPESLHLHAAGIVSQLPKLGLLVAGALIILALGLIDDRRKVGVRTKLAVQSFVALGMALGYERLSLFAEGSTWGDIVGTLVTVVWIVGVTNALNLLDHMDGLSSGVTCITGSCFLAVAVMTEQWFIAASLAALTGSLLAFLRFNFPPARIFLGDAGSLFIGFVLATLTVSFTFYEADDPITSYATPLVVLAVPLFDTASVIWIRLRRKRSIFEADRNHVAHRLVELGLSPKSAVLSVYGLTAVTGAAATQLTSSSRIVSIASLATVPLVFLAMTIVEHTALKQTGSKEKQ